MPPAAGKPSIVHRSNGCIPAAEPLKLNGQDFCPQGVLSPVDNPDAQTLMMKYKCRKEECGKLCRGEGKGSPSFSEVSLKNSVHKRQINRRKRIPKETMVKLV